MKTTGFVLINFFDEEEPYIEEISLAETERGKIMSLNFYLTTKDIDGNEMEVYDGNITHNLIEMAIEAGIHKALWRPDENGYKTAKDVVSILEKGLADLKGRPAYFKQFDSPNGWGLYKHFVPYVEEVLQHCRKYPSAVIAVSR